MESQLYLATKDNYCYCLQEIDSIEEGIKEAINLHSYDFKILREVKFEIKENKCKK